MVFTTPAIKTIIALFNRNSYPIQLSGVATPITLGIFLPAMLAITDGTVF